MRKDHAAENSGRLSAAPAGEGAHPAPRVPDGCSLPSQGGELHVPGHQPAAPGNGGEKSAVMRGNGHAAEKTVEAQGR